MLPACVWENEQTRSLNCNVQITKPFLRKFSVRKKKLCKSTEVPFSWKLAFPKGEEVTKEQMLNYLNSHSFSVMFLWFFIMKKFAWNEHQAELCTSQSWPYTWSLTQPRGPSMDVILCSIFSWSLVLSIAECKSFTWIFSHSIKSDLNIL